jgi:hypothetical protein
MREYNQMFISTRIGANFTGGPTNELALPTPLCALLLLAAKKRILNACCSDKSKFKGSSGQDIAPTSSKLEFSCIT